MLIVAEWKAEDPLSPAAQPFSQLGRISLHTPLQHIVRIPWMTPRYMMRHFPRDRPAGNWTTPSNKPNPPEMTAGCGRLNFGRLLAVRCVCHASVQLSIAGMAHTYPMQQASCCWAGGCGGSSPYSVTSIQRHIILAHLGTTRPSLSRDCHNHQRVYFRACTYPPISFISPE